jgi:hypothetical protein
MVLRTASTQAVASLRMTKLFLVIASEAQQSGVRPYSFHPLSSWGYTEGSSDRGLPGEDSLLHSEWQSFFRHCERSAAIWFFHFPFPPVAAACQARPHIRYCKPPLHGIRVFLCHPEPILRRIF